MFSRCLHITSFCTLEHWINVRSAAICSSLTRDRANEERSEAQNYHITRRFWAWEASNESSEIKIPLSGIMTILHREPVTTFEPNRIELGFRWLAEKSSRFVGNIRWISAGYSRYSLSLFLSMSTTFTTGQPQQMYLCSVNRLDFFQSTFRRTTEKWKHRWKSSNPSLDLTRDQWLGTTVVALLLLLLLFFFFFFFFQPPLCVPSFSITWKATRRSPLRTRLGLLSQQRASSSRSFERSVWNTRDLKNKSRKRRRENWICRLEIKIRGDRWWWQC